MDAFYKEFGRRVREARTSKDGTRTLTQEALARRLGLTRTSITNIEKGYQGVPLHTLVELAKALGVAPGDLLPQDVAEGQPLPERLLEGLDEVERRFVGRVVSDGDQSG
jgi:transcriptional regulator with XRE-family HTH domain